MADILDVVSDTLHDTKIFSVETSYEPGAAKMLILRGRRDDGTEHSVEIRVVDSPYGAMLAASKFQ